MFCNLIIFVINSVTILLLDNFQNTYCVKYNIWRTAVENLIILAHVVVLGTVAVRMSKITPKMKC